MRLCTAFRNQNHHPLNNSVQIRDDGLNCCGTLLSPGCPDTWSRVTNGPGLRMLFADRSTNAVCTIGRTYNMQTRATTISYGLAFIDRTRCIKLLPSWSTESKSGYVKCSETDCFGPSRRRQRWSTATANKVVEEAAVAYRRCGGGGYGGGGGGAAEDNAVVYRRRRLLRTHRMTRADALPSCNLQYRVQVEPTSDHVQSVFCEPSRRCYNNTARRDHFCQTLHHRESNITKILHSLPSFEPFIVDITVNRNKS